MLGPEALPLEAIPMPESLQNDPVAPDIETSSERYAHRFAGAGGAFLLETQARAITSLLDRLPSTQLRVLDVGGGHGHLASLFLDRGHSVTVHGSSAACFGRIQEIQKHHPDQVRFLLGSLQRLPAVDREYDLVSSIRLLGHTERWRELLGEKCRAASRYVICEFAVPEGLQRFAGALFGVKLRMEPDTRPFRAFTLREISDTLEEHGFRVTAVERQLVLPVAIHRRMSSVTLSRAAESGFRRAGITRRVGSPVVILAERRSRWSGPNIAS